MFAVVKNNQVVYTLQPGQQLFVDGVDYGFNWLTALDTARLAQLGVQEVVNTPMPDQQYYWVSSTVEVVDGVATWVHATTPKDLAELKQQAIANAKASANQQLQQTDWTVIRKFERNVDIPLEVAAARQAIVDQCTAKEVAILASTTVEELIQAVQ